jgi:pimeloyl-ACP methyl ester carboxylesterase
MTIGLRWRRRAARPLALATSLFCLSVAASGLAVAVSGHPARAAGGCQQVAVPVALGPGLPADQTIAGTFCEPESYAGPSRRVDVMVSGGTYSRAYWDFATAYPAYSYLHQTVAAGRAALAYDRLGTGASSRPQSALITADVSAYVLHQVVVWLRTQAGFGVVDAVGHSFGSVVAVAEAATFHDVDALVLTGYLHATGPATFRVTVLHPAALDPAFAGHGYDLGYLTSRPGTRAGLFYSAAADPAVVAEDEATKDVVSATFFTDALTQLNVPAPVNLSDAVRVPVLLVAGEQDAIYCGLTLDCTDQAGVRAHEVPYFAAAPSLAVTMVAQTGHDVALHPSAPQSFAAIDAWITALA